MATLTVWKFPTPHGADAAEYTLKDLESRDLIKLYDAAALSWDLGAKKPRSRQIKHLKSKSVLGGSFWGLLFGSLFLVPVLGVAVGAALGAVKASLSDVGIDDDFVSSVRDKVTPGTSALFVMSSDAVLDQVKEAFAGQDMELISTNLSSEQEQALLSAFAD